MIRELRRRGAIRRANRGLPEHRATAHPPRASRTGAQRSTPPRELALPRSAARARNPPPHAGGAVRVAAPASLPWRTRLPGSLTNRGIPVGRAVTTVRSGGAGAIPSPRWADRQRLAIFPPDARQDSSSVHPARDASIPSMPRSMLLAVLSAASLLPAQNICLTTIPFTGNTSPPPAAPRCST